MDTIIPIAVFLFAYLLGAVPFGLLIARKYGVADIRSHGSGNIGATNVWRIAGPGAAVWVYVLDIGKGIVAVLVARITSQTLLPQDTFLVLSALCAVLGHVFPIYLGFRGGKGVNTALGVVACLLPIEALICLGIFLLVVAVSRFISLGSILSSMSLALIVIGERQLLIRPVAVIYVYLTVALALLVLATHRKNVTRILNGSENRFHFSSGSSRKGDHAHV